MPAGELAIVLHTHMPYVEGFGTWPFGEEWLWEATATSYLPLLRLLDELGPTQSQEKLTLSLTPVLCDQLEAPGAIERCIAFLREVRPETHRLEIEELGRGADPRAVEEIERSAAEYAAAADTLERLHAESSELLAEGSELLAEGSELLAEGSELLAEGSELLAEGSELLAEPGGLVQALGRHARWTSSATHAILPLLALDESLDLQLRVGIESHRHRFGEWEGGFWLPECAYAPWLNGMLADAGVHQTCAEFTTLFGSGDPRNLRPLKPYDGPTLVPIDRASIDLAWGEHGYPSRPAYRDSHRHTRYRHRLWANDGDVYDADRAQRQAREDAHEFVAAIRDRVKDGGLCVCALDTELLGHWWYEGPAWLAAVIDEAERQGLALTALTAETLERHPAVATDESQTLPVSSWGTGGDLRTWSAPTVADLAWQARRAELQAFLHNPARPTARALRELLALQGSDWAFLAHRDWAGDYPRQRASGHAAQLSRALAGETEEQHVRNLAPYLELSYS